MNDTLKYIVDQVFIDKTYADLGIKFLRLMVLINCLPYDCTLLDFRKTNFIQMRNIISRYTIVISNLISCALNG